MSTGYKRTIAVCAFVGLAFVLALSGARQAEAVPSLQSANITLEPATGAPGSEILVIGSGFTPGEMVVFYWGSTASTPVDRAQAEQDGTFRHAIEVPLDADQGDLDAIARGDSSQVQAASVLEVMMDALAVDTLVLVDYDRMKALGYAAADVDALETKVNTLVGLPKSQSNMAAVIRRMSGEAQTWDGNEDSASETNAYVLKIDTLIVEPLKLLYPNLQYVIIVGSHEVIPMQARPADDMDDPYQESQWVSPLSTGRFKDLYADTTDGAERGRYLTDSVYGDLSYVANGYGVDDELIPELAVGRLVETPLQIGRLVDNYMASYASFSRGDMVSIASYDYMDGGQEAANHMGTGADTLFQSSFSPSLIPPLVNANDDVVYLAGHGDYDYISPGFRAGTTGTGNTADLNNMPDAVVVTSGCHNGVSFWNRLYSASYAEFPEEFAEHRAGIYLGATGYTWISGSASSTNVAYTGWNEKLATHFIKHLLNDGMWTTAGQAYKDAVNEYVSDYGGIGNPHRRVLSIATLYGIPNYHPPRITVFIPWKLYGYSLSIQQFVLSSGAGFQATDVATETITLEVTDWYTDTDGLVHIPGASYTGDCDVATKECEPVLPIVNASRLVPTGTQVVGVTWLQSESVSQTIANDVPLATIAVLTESITGTMPAGTTGIFYPSNPYYTSTLSTLGAGALEVVLTAGPVQYRQSTGETRIWTKMVFEIELDVDPAALGADDDNDGLPNYWESGHGLSPNDAEGDQGASGDPDLDGLTNTQERDRGTDPLSPDTDHDGSPDGLEVTEGTDPLDPGSGLGHIYLPVALRGYAGP